MASIEAPARPRSSSAVKRAFERYPFLPALIILVVLMWLLFRHQIRMAGRGI